MPIDNFKWETDLSKFTSDFIKNYDESDIGHLLVIDAVYPKNIKSTLIYHFYLVRLISYIQICEIKNTILSIFLH